MVRNEHSKGRAHTVQKFCMKVSAYICIYIMPVDKTHIPRNHSENKVAERQLHLKKKVVF